MGISEGSDATDPAHLRELEGQAHAKRLEALAKNAEAYELEQEAKALRYRMYAVKEETDEGE